MYHIDLHLLSIDDKFKHIKAIFIDDKQKAVITRTTDTLLKKIEADYVKSPIRHDGQIVLKYGSRCDCFNAAGDAILLTDLIGRNVEALINLKIYSFRADKHIVGVYAYVTEMRVKS